MNAKAFLWASTAATALYEIAVSSPWWTGAKSGRYDMLIQLSVPSIFLLLFSYYLFSKSQKRYSIAISVFIICLQVAIGFTIMAAARGLLP